MNVHSETGPRVNQSRARLYDRAVELRSLAAAAADHAQAGPGQNLSATLQIFDRMRAILGEGRAGEADHGPAR